MSGARSAECRCAPRGDWGTCGHCLRNAPPWHFTPSTSAEIMARQIAAPPAPQRQCDCGQPIRDAQCFHCGAWHESWSFA